MFLAKPATAGADAFERLHLFFTKESPTAFDIKRLERDADALERADKGEAFIVRSGIAALKWNLEEAKFWIGKASMFDGGYFAHANAAVTYRYMNAMQLSADHTLKALEANPLDANLVRNVVGTLTNVGRLTDANVVAAQFVQRSGQVLEQLRETEELLQAIADAGVDEAEVRAELQCAMEVLTEAKIRHDHVMYTTCPEPDGGTTIAVSVAFTGDFEDEMRLEAVLAEKLMDLSDWNPARLSVELKYLRQDASQPA